MERQSEQVKSTHANAASNRRVDGLRRLLNDPGVLAADPSACRVLAFTPTISLQNSSSRMDWNVGARGHDHGSLARRLVL